MIFNINDYILFNIKIKRYNEIVKKVNLCGPTSFAPIINKAIEIIKYNQQQKQTKLNNALNSMNSDSISMNCVEPQATTLVQAKMSYHILFIITDGRVSKENELETIRSIINASLYPLSIVLIGVGDGPFNKMMKYDDLLCTRSRFDNFQFVDYHRIIKNSKAPDITFALHALMEIPEQYKIMKKLNYI
jgi:E3 ubiquitin-protein ligase RGLG